MNNKLYVGNLAFETTESDLNELFSAAGTVRETTLIMDRTTGKSRGFAFVVMGNAHEAEAAINQFNEQEYQGRNLTVNIAREREDRSGGGGGGGRQDNRRGGSRRY